MIFLTHSAKTVYIPSGVHKMKSFPKLLRTLAAATLALFAATSYAAAAPHYLITNNDNSRGNSATVYTILGDFLLKQKTVINTGGTGVDGLGAVATKRVSILNSPTQACAFLSDAGTADVAGISIPSLAATGTFKAASTDSAPFGMPVVNNGPYVYAGFTGSNTLATYQILPGCTLKFVQDIPASGVNGGSILDMWVHQNILVASFQDGSIESFNVAAGVPVSNGDLQYSTGYAQNNSFVAGVDITADGHYAIFGGTGSPPLVEVSDISSGTLRPTVVYANLGNGSGSEAIWLSPDESLLYLSNFSSNQVTATHFDKTTGTVSFGCSSPTLKGNTFEAGLATATTSGTGTTLFVAEPEINIASVHVTENSGSCSLNEDSRSPASDTSTITIESIGVYPPRPF
jgi:6-phosphogluconolactonase (cycloisomerase 2 family)